MPDINVSSAIFGDSSTGASFALSCPASAFIVNFYGRVGAMLDAVGVVCSDGSTLGPFGGTGGGSSSTATCQNGFSSVRVEFVTDYGWNSIGGIVTDCSGSRSSLDGYNSGVVTEFACPTGQVLQAVRGTEGGRNVVIYSLQFTCTANVSESGKFARWKHTS